MEQNRSTEPARFTAKGRATRGRIVAAAAELFYYQGVRATSIEDVRRKAGVSGSQISHYFADKRELVQAVVEFQAADVARIHQQPALGGLDTLASLRLWVNMTLDQDPPDGPQLGCRFGSLSAELVKSDPPLRPPVEAGYRAWLRLLETSLRAMRDRGELREDADPEALALGLLAAHQGGALLSQALQTSAPMRAALELALGRIETYATATTDR